MPMSVFFRDPPPMRRVDVTFTAREPTRGFTLFEILIVLAIIGMTSAIVIPRLGTMASSFAFAADRDNLEQTLNSLSYQAFRNNSDIVLAGRYTEDSHEAYRERAREPGDILDSALLTRPIFAEEREHLPPVNPTAATVSLPAGWELVVENPIYFRGSGYCSGGTAELHVGRLQYSYVLTPPLCRAVLAE